MAGDYLQYKGKHSNKTTDLDMPTGTPSAFPNAIAVKSAAHQLFIQKIVLSITTHVAGDVYTFDDDGSGGVIASHIDVAAGATALDVITWDFGPEGMALTVGANLDAYHTTTGVARVHIEAYEKLVTSISYLSGASLQ